MTQSERVLAALRRGPVNTTAFLAPTIDGQAPIIRLAARVRELRQRGYVIDSQRAKNGTSTYFLTDGVGQSEGLTSEIVEAYTERSGSDIDPSTIHSLSVMEDARGREADPPSGPTLFDAPRVSGGYRDTERAA